MKKILFSIVLLSALACNDNTPVEGEAAPAAIADRIELTPAQQAHITLSTTHPELRAINEVVRLQGEVILPPEARHEVSVPYAGQIKSARGVAGMKVTKGEELANVQSPDYLMLQEDWLKSRAALSGAEKEYERMKELIRTRAASQRDFELAEADYQSKLAQHSAAEERVRLLGLDPKRITPEALSGSITLRSPIGGIVSEVNVHAGMGFSAGQKLYTVVDPSAVQFRLVLYEKDLYKVKTGQVVVLTAMDGAVDSVFATVKFIGPDLGADKSVLVTCTPNSGTASLAPGAFIAGEIHTSDVQTISVPLESVLRNEGKHVVFVKESDSVYRLTEVEVISESDGFAAIRSGVINEQTEVVVKGAYQLLNALKVGADE
jgi:membrane fusion protein, heavy metal efflux system